MRVNANEFENDATISDETLLTHVSGAGQLRMVDVGDKPSTERTARAEAVVRLGTDLAAQLARTGVVAKGPVLETARLAGIMAAKRTA